MQARGCPARLDYENMPASNSNKNTGSFRRYALLNQQERDTLGSSPCVLGIDVSQVARSVLEEMSRAAEKISAPLQKDVAKVTHEMIDGMIEQIGKAITAAGNPAAIYLAIAGHSGTLQAQLQYQKSVIASAMDHLRERLDAKGPNASHRLNRMDHRANLVPGSELMLIVEKRLTEFFAKSSSNSSLRVEISRSAEPGECIRKMILWMQQFSSYADLRKIIVTTEIRAISDTLAASNPGMLIYSWNRMTDAYDQFSSDKMYLRMTRYLPDELRVWKRSTEIDMACLVRLTGTNRSHSFGFTLGEATAGYLAVIAKVNYRSISPRSLIHTTVNGSLSMIAYPDCQILAQILRHCQMMHKPDPHTDVAARECMYHLVGRENGIAILEYFHHGALEYKQVEPLINRAIQLCLHYQKIWKVIIHMCRCYHSLSPNKRYALDEQMHAFYWSRLTGDLFDLMLAHKSAAGLTTLSSLFPVLEAHYYQVSDARAKYHGAAKDAPSISPPELPFFVTGIDRRAMITCEEKVFQTYYSRSRLQAPLRNAIRNEPLRSNLISEALARYMLDFSSLFAHPVHPINAPAQFGVTPQTPPSMDQFCDVLDRISLSQSRSIAVEVVCRSRVPHEPFCPPVDRLVAAAIISNDMRQRVQNPRHRISTLLCSADHVCKTASNLVIHMDQIEKIQRSRASS